MDSKTVIMKAFEYDKTEHIFKYIMSNYEQKCNESGIRFNYCYNTLMYNLQRYKHEKNKISLIERMDFSDKNSVKILLNKAYFSSKDEELRIAKENFLLLKTELFNFLDNTKDPYFFILHPFYKFGSGILYKDIPYQKDNMSGIQNIDIACDYAIYKTLL